MNLPPGPAATPLRQAIEFGRDPYGYLERSASEHGPIFTLRLPGDPPRVVVCEPAEIRRIFAMKADEIRACPDGIPVNLGKHTLLLLDGEAHRRDRQLLTPPLHGDRLRSYAQTMHDVTVQTLAALPRDTPIDLHRALQDITLEVILRCVFGVRDDAERDRLARPLVAWLDGTFVPTAFFAGMVLGWGRVRDGLDRAAARAAEPPHGALARLLAPVRRRLPWNRVGAAKAEVMALLRTDLQRCRADGIGDRVDILATLAQARYDDGTPIAIDHAIDELVTMLVGGHETTANTLAWTLAHVLPNAEVLARLHAELREHFGDGAVDPARCQQLRYLDACLDEAMRLTPIAPAVPRLLARDHQLGAWTLPAGTILFPCTYVTHRRADLWPEPTAFRPERFLDGKVSTDRYFPFGGGRRTCIGMTFARFEMRIVLASLLAHAELRAVERALPPARMRGLTIAPAHLRAQRSA
ncbi:MAG: cytochrome P450 [Nannocystaceae bacterium]|nr:cytochrome P450 [Nannocystaceae bacterium]